MEEIKGIILAWSNTKIAVYVSSLAGLITFYVFILNFTLVNILEKHYTSLLNHIYKNDYDNHLARIFVRNKHIRYIQFDQLNDSFEISLLKKLKILSPLIYIFMFILILFMIIILFF